MYKKPSLLLIDDEERILRSLSMLFRGQYQVQTTTDPHAALAMVERESPYVVVLSDSRMPGIDGAALLKRFRQKSPDTVRLLLTGSTELNAI